MKYRICKTDECGNLYEGFIQIYDDGDDGTPKEKIGVEVVDFHFSDCDDARYVGWCGGAYEYSYSFEGEVDTIYILIEEIKE